MYKNKNSNNNQTKKNILQEPHTTPEKKFTEKIYFLNFLKKKVFPRFFMRVCVFPSYVNKISICRKK